MRSCRCLCDFHRVSVSDTEFAPTTPSATYPSILVTRLPTLSAGLSVYTSAPLRRIAAASAQTCAMASPRHLVSSVSGGASWGPPSSLVRNDTSGGAAVDGPTVQFSGRDTTCQGYIGQGARLAGQYHECDFDWHEHARTVRHLVEAQQAAALALRSRLPGKLPGEGVDEPLQQARPLSLQQQQQKNEPYEQKQPHGQPPQQPAMAPASVVSHCDGNPSDQGGPSTSTTASPRLQSPTTMCTNQRQRFWSASELRANSRSQPDRHEAMWFRTVPEASPQLPTPRVAAVMLREQPEVAEGRPSGDPAAGNTSSSAPKSAITRAVIAKEDATVNQSTGFPTSNTGEQDRSCTQIHIHDRNGDMAPSVASVDVYEGSRWEEFYRAHPSARFFKERRYLLLEFPDLLQCEHVAEIGCGCGSSILPVLKANNAARTTCTDISTTCLEQLLGAAAAEGIAPSRLNVFPADATDPSAASTFDGIDADALLIMFTLSAVTPEQQHVMLSHAWRALRPGGRLLLRDHGLYDMVQLRIPVGQWVEPNLYKRGDGTMAYFFSTEELSRRATGAGFHVNECKYVTVINRNRKSGIELRRVFVHGVFEKPAA
ncbi:hypothetical protein VaNZ11_011592 [Volvox africanus]|uniref:Methyltransferase domain-containing protein n=1 Tax=Volvox africanus TaxID=51714 RepID=A0ABQ5SD76_9CHLO|nr:hypothetical protein VaNZ11_011592 [Volvox africanus]